MTYLDDSTIRQQLYHAYAIRATSGDFDNRAILTRILELRREKGAQLLGFADFADLVIDDRMAHTGARAQEFLENSAPEDGTAFRPRESEPRGFPAQHGRTGCARDSPWDVAYYAEKQRAALYDFDEEAAAPVFSAGEGSCRACSPFSAVFSASRSSANSVFRRGTHR
jgi:oligopeptidase A